MSMQEKFQITIPPKKDDSGGWVEARSVRTHQGNQQPAEQNKFNRMPTGYYIDDGRSDFHAGFGGDQDVSSQFVTPNSLGKGYTRLDMKGSDDQYTGEHVDLFYGEAKDENGNVGFVERNNYLDRE